MNFNPRKIFIISVLVICIVSINLAVYFTITQKPEEKIEEEIIIDTALLTENFNNIFDNTITYQESSINGEKELVYTTYTKKEKIEKSYDINVNIPYINISNDSAKQINNEINNLFYNKALEIINNNVSAVYSVNYKAYVMIIFCH